MGIQIDRQSLRVFSQADIDGNRVHTGEEGEKSNKETANGQD